MLQDLRFALRQLFKNPGFSIVAVLTLALAIGANTAIFSAVDAVLLHPLPYRNPEQLVTVGENFQHFALAKIPASPPEVMDYRRMATSFSSQAAVENRGSFTLTGNGDPEVIPGMHVTASIFPMLGVTPIAGGVFSVEEEQFGKHHVAVISEGLWKRRYGADPSVIGKNIELNQESYRVLGVIRPILEFRMQADIWTPLAFSPADLAPQSRGRQYIDVIGRLKPNVSIQQVNAEFHSIAARLAQQYPDHYQKNFGYSLDIDPLAERVAGDLRKPLLVLIGAVGVVMLIACANVSNLLLARAMMRRKEISIRAALGAGRGRMVRQLLTESVLLALVACAVGVMLALWGLYLYAQFGPSDLIHGAKPGINAWVMGFSILLSMAASVIFGLAPALETSRVDLNESLKEGSRGVTAGRRFLRESMVALEVAASLVLLIGAALLVRSFVRLEHTNPGFHPENVLTAQIVLPLAQYRQPAQTIAFQRSLLERVRSLPGVIAAGASDPMPFSNSFSAGSFDIVGRTRNPNDPSPVVAQPRTTPGYFEAMGIPLLRGRYFTAADSQGALPVAIIDDTVAKKFFPNEDPIGVKVTGAADRSYTIVGVVGAVKQRDLAADPQPSIYYSALQVEGLQSTLAIKTASNPLALIAALRHEVTTLDSNLPLARAGTLEQRLAESLARQRFSIQLMTVFAALAAVLAAIGIYGVLAYLVDQRRRELGIRVALGARPGDVLGLVLQQGSLPVGIGLIIGIGGALALTRVLKSLLFEVSATDPLIFASVSLGLIAVALVAMSVPARRATQVDPLEALRHE